MVEKKLSSQVAESLNTYRNVQKNIAKLRKDLVAEIEKLEATLEESRSALASIDDVLGGSVDESSKNSENVAEVEEEDIPDLSEKEEDVSEEPKIEEEKPVKQQTKGRGSRTRSTSRKSAETPKNDAQEDETSDDEGETAEDTSENVEIEENVEKDEDFSPSFDNIDNDDDDDDIDSLPF